MKRLILFAICLCAAPVAAQTFPITIDATALDAPDGFVISGVPGQFAMDSAHMLNLEPGFYSLHPFSTGFQLPFTVDAAGNVSYDPGLEPIVDGAATPTLTIVGFAMAIDVSSLSYSHMELVRAAATLDLTGPNNLRLLPGSYLVGVTGAPPGLQVVGIDAAGHFTYDASLEMTFDGAGTSTLIAVGHPVTVDSSGIDLQFVDMTRSAVPGFFDTEAPSPFRLLPGLHIIRSIEKFALHLIVGTDGKVGYDPAWENFLDGAGTTTLTLVGCPITVDARAIEPETFVIPQVGTFAKTTPVEIQLMPHVFPAGRAYRVRIVGDPIGDRGLFVTNQCLVDYDAQDEDIFSGRGTTTLVIGTPNSPPTVSPTGGGVFEIGPSSVVTLGGSVSDADGDLLCYAWTRGLDVLAYGTVDAPDNGSPIALPSDTVATTTLGVGCHILEVAVDDGTTEVTGQIDVEVSAAEAPVLAPVASDSILWPVDHKMHKVTIEANASDNSGGAVTLSVEVTSDEPVNGNGDGNTEPDWEILSVDSETGVICVDLRAERNGPGDGRTYTVTITATDAAGNSSMTAVEIVVPHNQGGN